MSKTKRTNDMKRCQGYGATGALKQFWWKYKMYSHFGKLQKGAKLKKIPWEEVVNLFRKYDFTFEENNND